MLFKLPLNDKFGIPGHGPSFAERTTASDYDIAVLIGFKDMQTALEWKNSDAYQKIVGIRLDASEGPLAIIPAM